MFLSLALELIFKCVLASLKEGLSVRPSVDPGRFRQNQGKINIFEQMNDRAGILGSLYVSLHIYKMVYWSVGLSVHQSVCHTFVNIN